MLIGFSGWNWRLFLARHLAPRYCVTRVAADGNRLKNAQNACGGVDILASIDLAPLRNRFSADQKPSTA
jgi:hypothetical protein